MQRFYTGISTFSIIIIAHLWTLKVVIPVSSDSGSKNLLCKHIIPDSGQSVRCHHPQKPKLKINCTYEESPEFSVASFTCEEFWRPKTDSAITVKQVCVNGEWLRESTAFSCTTKCGLSERFRSSGSVAGFPWVVSIFEKSRSYHHSQSMTGHKYICQGSLISTRAILTAAQCLTIQNSTVEQRVRDFKIVVGRRPTFLDIEKIVLHHGYTHKNLTNNLAIIWLKQALKIEAELMPVCLFTVGEAKSGIVPVIVNQTRKSSVKLVSGQLMDCDGRNNSLCVNLTNEAENLENYNRNGAGLYIIEEEIGIWTLRGVYTGSIYDESLYLNEKQVFTDLSLNRPWIDKELSREPPIYEESETKTDPELIQEMLPTSSPISTQREQLTPEPFLIPHFHSKRPVDPETISTTTYPEGIRKFSTKSVTTGMPSTRRHDHMNSNVTPFYSVLPTRFPISTSRPKLATTRKSSPEVIDLRDDVFYSNTNKPAKCPSISKPRGGIMQMCQHDEYEDFDDCSNGGYVGTVATSSCMAHYVSVFGPSSVKRECLSNGRWSNTRSVNCHLECGISASPRRSFIVNGILSDRISWPWHATIFRKIGNDIKYICGGTLIAKSIVLTAAHCVTLPGSTKIAPKEDFRVVLASSSSNYTENLLDTISNSNLFYVKSILVPDSYNGVTFDSDIGIIQLEFEVELTDYVKPVCFPFQTKESDDIEFLQLSPGTHGQTVGFGIDESGEPSTKLKEASLPVISHRECGEVLARFPSSSQFCAGYLNGTAVCNGDSGSGLYFSVGTGYRNRYILQGIVSFGDATSKLKVCNHETYAIFTKVGSFRTWVQEKLEKLEPEYNR